MDYQFTSLEELYKRVSPALYSKKVELQRLGYFHITERDIWDYLVEARWKKGMNLMLSDIVNDILNTDSDLISLYYENKHH